jgi:uroporphyrinogen III methyltransferase/synthase
MLVGGAIDCATFTSASTVRNFAQLFDANDLGQLLAGVRIACIGDVTAATAAEFGLRVHIQPDETTTHALARAIAEHFARERQTQG